MRDFLHWCADIFSHLQTLRRVTHASWVTISWALRWRQHAGQCDDVILLQHQFLWVYTPISWLEPPSIWLLWTASATFSFKKCHSRPGLVPWRPSSILIFPFASPTLLSPLPLRTFTQCCWPWTFLSLTFHPLLSLRYLWGRGYFIKITLLHFLLFYMDIKSHMKILPFMFNSVYAILLDQDLTLAQSHINTNFNMTFVNFIKQGYFSHCIFHMLQFDIIWMFALSFWPNIMTSDKIWAACCVCFPQIISAQKHIHTRQRVGRWGIRTTSLLNYISHSAY